MKKYILYFGFLALLAASSCGDENKLTDAEIGELEPVFSVSNLNGDIVADGAAVSFYVNSTQAWTISLPAGAAEWLTIDKTSGKSSLTVLVDVKVNKIASPRSAALTVTAEDGTATEVLISQPAQTLYLDTQEFSDVENTGNEYQINVMSSTGVYTAESLSPWIKTVIDGITLTIQVDPNAVPYAPAREGKVDVTCGDVTKTITVIQDRSEKTLTYEDFLGVYTMRYTTSNNRNAINRSRTATVTLEQAEQGETYYLKGILAPADEALGNIVVKYSEAKGIEILGQILFKRSGTNYDFWWLPYSNSDNGNYLSRSTTVGMVNADFNSSGNLSFSMVDNGVWGDQVLAGFMLRDYNGSTSITTVKGRDGQHTTYFPLFEKQ